MKIPRDESGESLVKRLKNLGYEITGQTCSHIRLTTLEESEHHITIPAFSTIHVYKITHIKI